MGQSVDANGRSILHKGHGMTHVCAVPDVCKTPTPGGPVPIPYPNLAMDSDLTDGTTSVKIEDNPVANVSSKIATSSGDEPGSVGGIMSNTFKGVMTWKMGSLDVKAEGKSVVRFLDTAFHNGNTFNSSFINVGGTGFAYGDDEPCEACDQPVDSHRVHETTEARSNAARLLTELLKIYSDQEDEIGAAMAARLEARMLVRENVAGRIRPADQPAFAAHLAALRATYQGFHTGLAGVHVLRHTRDTDCYTQGYMIGIALCKCGKMPVAACSGDATPGFQTAVARSDFTFAGTMPPLSERQLANGGRRWVCAAPKLINALGAHRPRTMTEIYFQPNRTVNVQYSFVDRQGQPRFVVDSCGYNTRGSRGGRLEGPTIAYRSGRRGTPTVRTFRSGDTVPSCDLCQTNLPEMLCNAQGECP